MNWNEVGWSWSDLERHETEFVRVQGDILLSSTNGAISVLL